MENLIFDRTQEDSDNETDKAFYWHEDFNRLETWCRYLADKLTEYNYPVDITTKTNWVETDSHEFADLERIRFNISKLKQAYYSFTNVPSNVELMTWQKANQLERVLYEIDNLLSNMIASFYYSGEVYSGEVEA